MFYAVKTKFGCWVNFITGQTEKRDSPNLQHLTVSIEVAGFWAQRTVGEVVIYELKGVE